MPWNDPNVTEQIITLENYIAHPGDAGGLKSLSLQRAGYLKNLRFWLNVVFGQTAGTGAPSKSAWGPLGAALQRIRVEANGKVPLYSLTGMGAEIYNEVENRDGSVAAPTVYDAVNNLTAGASLVSYTTPGTGAQTYTVKYPFELRMSVPVFIRGLATELGLWLLQDQSVDINLDAQFYPPYAAAATPFALYSGGTAVTGTTTLASSALFIERELYGVPAQRADRPDESFAHQVIEYTAILGGKFARFDIPASGLVLRAIMYVLDGSNNFVEWTDVDQVSVVYGSNVTPIQRTGWGMITEFLTDYNRYPFKGVFALDFYKWGLDTVRLVKNSEVLANFRIEVRMLTTATGTVNIILDTLVPVVRYTGRAA